MKKEEIKVSAENGLDSIYVGDKFKGKQKKVIFDNIRRKLSKISHIPNIIVWQGPQVTVNYNLLNLRLANVAHYQTVPSMYEFCSKDQYHVYANHAANKLGGGAITKGFVQEEKLTLTSSLIFPLTQKYLAGARYAILGTPLEQQPLLIKMNILLHENAQLFKEYYGSEGMEKINDNPAILQKLYRRHRSEPRVYWLCKAIPMLHAGEDYSKMHQGYPVAVWAFYLALESYLLSIKCVEQDRNIDTIYIHDGNWGCGAFNHNINTIYLLEHLAINVAVQLANPSKRVVFYYHTYNDEMMAKLKPAIAFWNQLLAANSAVDEALNILSDFHFNKIPEWSTKL